MKIFLVGVPAAADGSQIAWYRVRAENYDLCNHNDGRKATFYVTRESTDAEHTKEAVAMFIDPTIVVEESSLIKDEQPPPLTPRGR